jgi:hypothetical protein
VSATIEATGLALDVTAAVSPAAFVCEVERFRATVTNPSVPVPDKARAWDAIVRHAGLLDPRETGFERAGVALKEALCLWLDARPAAAHA